MMDEVLIGWMSGLIELSKASWVLGAGKPWTPGTRLKLLFAGYNGTRNTGSDVRVEEMMRQVRRGVNLPVRIRCRSWRGTTIQPPVTTAHRL